jgi:hypothetical protein
MLEEKIKSEAAIFGFLLCGYTDESLVQALK